MKKIVTHGSAKSNYDSKVRALASQYRTTEASLETIKSNLETDIKMIPRANTSIASNNYRIKIVNQFESTECLEIWNEVTPGAERKIVTITNE